MFCRKIFPHLASTATSGPPPPDVWGRLKPPGSLTVRKLKGGKDTFWARGLQRRIEDRGTIRRERVGEPLGERKMGVCSSSAAFSILPFWAFTHTVRVKPWEEWGKLHTHFSSFSSNRQFSTLELLSRSISFHFQASAAALLYFLHPSFFT